MLALSPKIFATEIFPENRVPSRPTSEVQFSTYWDQRGLNGGEAQWSFELSRQKGSLFFSIEQTLMNQVLFDIFPLYSLYGGYGRSFGSGLSIWAVTDLLVVPSRMEHKALTLTIQKSIGSWDFIMSPSYRHIGISRGPYAQNQIPVGVDAPSLGATIRWNYSFWQLGVSHQEFFYNAEVEKLLLAGAELTPSFPLLTSEFNKSVTGVQVGFWARKFATEVQISNVLNACDQTTSVVGQLDFRWIPNNTFSFLIGYGYSWNWFGKLGFALGY